MKTSPRFYNNKGNNINFERFTSIIGSPGWVGTRTTVLLMVVSPETSTMMLGIRTGIGGLVLELIICFVMMGHVSEVNLALVWANIIRDLKGSRQKRKVRTKLQRSQQSMPPYEKDRID